MNRYTYSMHISKIGDEVHCCHCKLVLGTYTSYHGRTHNAYTICPRCGWDQRTKEYKPCECNSDHCIKIRSDIREREEFGSPNGYVAIP